jgi:hypothetical protein
VRLQEDLRKITKIDGFESVDPQIRMGMTTPR